MTYSAISWGSIQFQTPKAAQTPTTILKNPTLCGYLFEGIQNPRNGHHFGLRMLHSKGKELKVTHT